MQGVEASVLLLGVIGFIAWASYYLGRLRRDREWVSMLHGAFLANLHECRDQVFAADVMLVSILCGVEGRSAPEFFAKMRSPSFRHQARLEARDFIHTLEER